MTVRRDRIKKKCLRKREREGKINRERGKEGGSMFEFVFFREID